MELDGPLQEMVGILKNEKDEEERIRVTDTLFTALTISKNKDLTRYIRRIGNDILKASNREAFLEEFDEIVYDVADAFQGKEKVDLETMRQLN